MEKKKAFVIMPFQDQFFEVYEMLKMHFVDSFEFSNAADEGNQQNILKDIVQPIYEADVVIADLTGLNPNVMYELGLAHSFNKKTITITQDDLSTLPFDLKQYRAKDYSTHFKKFAELLEYLSANLNGAIDNSVIYGNPVKDFLDSAGIKDVSWFAEKEVVELSDESDKGFIDFLTLLQADADFAGGFHLEAVHCLPGIGHDDLVRAVRHCRFSFVHSRCPEHRLCERTAIMKGKCCRRIFGACISGCALKSALQENRHPLKTSECLMCESVKNDSWSSWRSEFPDKKNLYR